MRKTSAGTAGDTYRLNFHNGIRDEARASSYLLPYETSPAGLTLNVAEGNVYFGADLVEFAGDESDTFTAPSANPRIDLLSLDSDGNLVRTAGAEAASPVAPATPAGNFPICYVYNRVGQTTILETDDSSNGYIYKDLRQFARTDSLSGMPVLRLGTGATRYEMPGWNILTTDVTSFFTSAGYAYFSPLYIAKETTYTEVVLYVSSASGSASDEARVGIYKGTLGDNGLDLGDLILDAGKINLQVDGIKTLAISETLSPGFYFICVVVPTAFVGDAIDFRGIQYFQAPVSLPTTDNTTYPSDLPARSGAGAWVADGLPSSTSFNATYSIGTQGALFFKLKTTN